MASWTETIKAALRKERVIAPKKPVAPRPTDIPVGDGWLLGAGEISNALGVSPRTFHTMKERGDLPFLRLFTVGKTNRGICEGVGGTTRLMCRRDEIEAWKLGRQTIGTAEKPRRRDEEDIEQQQEAPK